MFGAQKMQFCSVGQTINISCMMNPLRLLTTKLSSLYRKLVMGAHIAVFKMNLLKYIQSGLHSEIKFASRVNLLGNIAAGMGVVLVSLQNHVIAPTLTLTSLRFTNVARYIASLREGYTRICCKESQSIWESSTHHLPRAAQMHGPQANLMSYYTLTAWEVRKLLGRTSALLAEC